MSNKKQIFEDLYKKYKQQIFLFVLARTNSREDALDITANTFLAAWENLESFQGAASYKTWLFAICRHKITDFYRKSYRESTVFDYAYDINNYSREEVSDNTDSSLINKFKLQDLLNKLKEMEKELILLKYMNNLNFAECADVLHISETNARVMHHRIILKLRNSL